MPVRAVRQFLLIELLLYPAAGFGHVSMPFPRRVREVALEEILAASG